MCRLSLLALLTFCLCEPLNAQSNFVRVVPTGAFRVPNFWSPYNPPTTFGPGDNNDRVIFDLGFDLFNTYTITGVGGINDQLIVGNDSVRLEITDYETVSNDLIEDGSIVVGLSTGEVGILTLSGGPGSELRSVRTYLGINGTGSAIVDSADLNWTNAEEMVLGTGGNGNLLIREGTVSCLSSAIGSGIESQSAVTVTGPDSHWTSTDQLFVGLFGDGSLSIEAGGQVSFEDAFMGFAANSTGAVTVTGSDSAWHGRELAVGDEGIGALEILDGGQVTSFSCVVGNQKSSSGSILLNGAESELSIVQFSVGQLGDGELTILGGTVTSGYAEIGMSATANIVVSGPESAWHNNGLLAIENAFLTIENGGTVTSLSGQEIADARISDGVVTVSGFGSSFITGGGSGERLGIFGGGRMNVVEGGEVVSNIAGIGRRGSVFVSGFSSNWKNDLDLFIDGDPFADLEISAGGQVRALGNLIVGQEDAGTLTISMDASCRCDSTAFVGQSAGGEGNVDVSGTGALWQIGEDLVIGGSLKPGPINGGTGIVTVSSGGALCVLDDVVLLPAGTLELDSSGIVSVDEIDTTFGGSFDFVGGTLHVDRFIGDLENQGGSLSPGNVPFETSSIGSTTVEGNYSQDQFSSMRFQVSGAQPGTGFDISTVVGNVFLDGSLEVEVVEGYVPLSTDTFPILNVSQGNLFGFFNDVGDNQRIDTTDGSGSFLVRYGPTSPNPNQIVLSDFQPNANAILGDANGDELFNNADIAAFVLALTNPVFYEAIYSNVDPDIVLDMNGDGAFNNGDIAAFVAALTGP